MQGRIAVLMVATLLTGAISASAQIYVPQSLERDFRIEWQVTQGKKGPAIEGYVYNTAMRGAEHMRLKIERLDEAGRVAGTSTVSVLGVVPMDGRAYFSASVPASATYRVQALSFDWTCSGAGGGSGM